MKEIRLLIDDAYCEQFMGFIRLSEHVQVVSECEVKDRRTPRNGGRPKQTGMPIRKTFSYCGRETCRLTLLCKGLKALGWIADETDEQLFLELFSGVEIRQRIIWKGPANTLAELFRRLVNERSLVTLPEKLSLWVMVNAHFWEQGRGREFGTSRLRKAHAPKEHEQLVGYLVGLLDCSTTIEEFRLAVFSRR